MRAPRRRCRIRATGRPTSGCCAARARTTRPASRAASARHEVALDLLYAGERRDFGFPAQAVLPAYWLANLSAKVALGEHFTLVAASGEPVRRGLRAGERLQHHGPSFFGALRYEFR